MVKKDEYTKLAEKLEAPVSKRFLAILEAMFTLEEAKICLELFAPSTCSELASRLKVDEKSLLKKLENLVNRGVLTRGKTQYGFHTRLITFHHDVVADTAVHYPGIYEVPKKVEELWADFFRNEWADIFVENATKRSQELKGQYAFGEIWPAIRALELSPNIRPEQILPQENWKLRIENAKRRIIAPCGCRVVWGTCDSPMEVCFACFDNRRGEYYLGKPGRLLREVSLEETLDIVYRAEEAGLVHWADCYCCRCCCEKLYSYTSRGKRCADLQAPNRFRAVVNEELCNGCQVCVERCPFDAIEMQKTTSYKKLKASIINENCMGCGVCIVGCKQRALRYEIVRPPEWILNRPRMVPPTPVRPSEPPRMPAWGFYNLE